MGDPDVEATAAQIIAQCPGAAVERTALTVAQLGRLAPLSLTWEDDTTAPRDARRAPSADRLPGERRPTLATMAW